MFHLTHVDLGDYMRSDGEAGRIYTNFPPEVVARFKAIVDPQMNARQAQEPRHGRDMVASLADTYKQRRATIVRRLQTYSDRQMADAHIEHYQSGLSIAEVAIEVGCSASTLATRWRRLGAPITDDQAGRFWQPPADSEGGSSE